MDTWDLAIGYSPTERQEHQQLSVGVRVKAPKCESSQDRIASVSLLCRPVSFTGKNLWSRLTANDPAGFRHVDDMTDCLSWFGPDSKVSPTEEFLINVDYFSKTWTF